MDSFIVFAIYLNISFTTAYTDVLIADFRFTILDYTHSPSLQKEES